MNFFGHASVAACYETSPIFVLGAMLPDFFAMLRIKPVKTSDPNLGRGIELHHATDAAFHAAEPFLELTRLAQLALVGAGLARGPARAVAHIGVELLLDEVLAAHAGSRDAYIGALASADESAERLDFRAREDEERYLSLLSLLAARGAPDASTPPGLVADRIERALRDRPRLALDAHARAQVSDCVVVARPAVVESSSALLTVLRARLNAPSSR